MGAAPPSAMVEDGVLDSKATEVPPDVNWLAITYVELISLHIFL